MSNSLSSNARHEMVYTMTRHGYRWKTDNRLGSYSTSFSMILHITEFGAKIVSHEEFVDILFEIIGTNIYDYLIGDRDITLERMLQHTCFVTDELPEPVIHPEDINHFNNINEIMFSNGYIDEEIYNNYKNILNKEQRMVYNVYKMDVITKLREVFHRSVNVA